jgi:hypothetical protein
MPTMTETEQRLRDTLTAVASSVRDSDDAARRFAGASLPMAIAPACSRAGGARRRPLLVFAASFLGVLLVGAVSLFTNVAGNSDTAGVSSQLDETPVDPVVSGLGMDGTYFALDDPSWAVIHARTTTEGGQGTLLQYERGDQVVVIYTGGAAKASGLLGQSPTDPGPILELNSNQVIERSYVGVVSFNWMTSEGLAVVVEFGQMNRNQAIEASTALQPVEAEAWEQLTAAAMSDLRARTGKFGTGGEEGFGELIRLDAPDAPDVILELAEGIELPPGQTFDRMIENLPDEPTEQTEAGIKATLEFEAGCIWTGYWLDAVEAGDTDARDEAVAVLEEIPSWPALNTSDGGGVTDAWTRNAELAAAGDVQGVLDNLYTNNCTDVVPGQ